MKYFLTGASGFLGKTIKNQVIQNAKLITLGRTVYDDIQITDFASLQDLKKFDENIDRIIHAAGLAHFSNESDNLLFEKINFDGTRLLCKWIETWINKPKSFIFISTVSVYGIKFGNEISEDSPLNADGPYAVSKIKAEVFLIEWGRKWGIEILILRLPLIIGSNPPGNLGKMIRGINQGTYFSVGGGKARKSMVLAEDVAKLVIDCPNVSGIYNLTDGYHPSFAELESVICKQLNKSKPFNIPNSIAKILGNIGDLVPIFPVNSNVINKIIEDLTFSDQKARKDLGWNPTRVIDNWKL